MEIASNVPLSGIGYRGQQDSDFINLHGSSMPSTPGLQPVLQIPTMSKKLSLSKFEDERIRILKSASDLLQHPLLLEAIQGTQNTGNLVELNDGNPNSNHRFSGSIDQISNVQLLEQSFQELTIDKQENTEPRLLSLTEKLRLLSPLVEPFMTDCFPADDRRTVIYSIAEAFHRLNLHDFHRISGEGAVTDLLQFFVGIPLNRNLPSTVKQEKRIHQIRSALFKECGFSLEVGIIPVMCLRHKRSIFHFSFRDSAQLPFRLITLLRVKSKNKKEILMDSNSRVYKNITDWRKTNTLSPSRVFVSTANESCREENSAEQPFTLRQFETPSCKTSKMALDVMDIAVGIGAVGAGVACLATGGLIALPVLPFLLAGELAASVYMGYRGTMSFLDKRKHRPKSWR